MSDYTVSITLQAVDNASQAVAGLKNALAGVGDAAEKQKNNSPEQITAWQQYKNAIDTVSGAIGTVNMAMDMLGQGLELVDLGENVHAVRLAFEALQGGVQPAADTMQALREATSGVISDVDLMSATNRLQSMGLGETADDFAELIGMAQQLGSVMSPGATAAQNIDNFTLLLANQSVRRLDSFGISADAVKQRIDELKDAGYSAQDAFNMAVMEQGRIALERLGDAATAGATNVDRLSTRWQNFWNTFAEGAAGFVNQAAGTLEMIGGITDAASNGAVGFDPFFGFSLNPTGAAANPYGQFGGAAEAAQAYIGSTTGGGSFDMTTGSYVPSGSVDPFIQGDTLTTVSAEFTAQMQAAKDAAYEAQVAAANMMSSTREMIGADLSYSASQIQAMNQDMMSFEEAATMAGGAIMDAANASAELAGQVNIINDMGFSVLAGSQITGLIAQGADAATASLAAVESALALYNMPAFSAQTTVGGTTFDRGAIGDTTLFTPEEAQYASDVATYYNNLLNDATLLHQQGLISDAELMNVQSTADAASSLADQAERGALAFENMTLSQALMTQGGGMFGEIGGDVASYMAQMGFSDYQQQVFTNAYQMQSGQQTQSSQTYESSIVPMIAQIASEYGAQAAAVAMGNVQQGMQTGQLMGMTDAQIAAAMSGMTGYQQIDVGAAAGQQYQMVGSGYATQTVLEQNDQFGGIDAYMETVGTIETSTENIATQTDTMKSNMEAGAVAAASMKNDINLMANRLASINGRSMTINLRFNTSAARGELAALIREVVGDNGGHVPGGGTDDHPGTGGT